MRSRPAESIFVRTIVWNFLASPTKSASSTEPARSSSTTALTSAVNVKSSMHDGVELLHHLHGIVLEVEQERAHDLIVDLHARRHVRGGLRRLREALLRGHVREHGRLERVVGRLSLARGLAGSDELGQVRSRR